MCFAFVGFAGARTITAMKYEVRKTCTQCFIWWMVVEKTMKNAEKEKKYILRCGAFDRAKQTHSCAIPIQTGGGGISATPAEG